MSGQDNKKFDIELNLEELNIVLGALAEAPAKISMKLIINIQQQVRAASEKTLTIEE